MITPPHHVMCILQVLQCVASLAFVAFYVYRFAVVSETVEHLRATYLEQFVDVAEVALWDQVCLFAHVHSPPLSSFHIFNSFFQILRILLGILVLLLILRSLHLLRHRRPFSVVASVLRHSVVDIFALFVSHRTDDVITCKL